MSLVSPVYEQHYKDYLDKLAGLDFPALGPAVGCRVTTGPQGQGLEIPYFNRSYQVSPAGITDGSGRQPGYDTCIILCRYLIMAGDRSGKTVPDGGRQDDWAGFRDLKDSGPLTVYFKDNVETAIAGILAGKMPVSPETLVPLNACPPDMDLQYDLALKVDALPRVPMLLLVNDEEDGFPSSCSVLFQSGVEVWLDAECIAMAGYRLAEIIRKRFS